MAHTQHTTSQAVIAAVADREGVAASDLETPLYDAINPEALDDIFRASPGEVNFEYAGYDVRVDHDHNVELTALAEH